MRKLLDEVQDGSLAERWIKENEDGQPWFKGQRRLEQDLTIESVGAELRQMMPFLDPVTVKPGE